MEAGHEIADPWAVLGLTEDASLEEIRMAYLRRVKEHPPDRHPEDFERIRDAYEVLRDPYQRTRRLILGVDPSAPLVSLLDKEQGRRRFAGPRAWLDALEEA